MAEDRMLRAELRISETVNAWPIPLRFFWTQLWGFCDDYGRGRDEPRVIVADTFPLDSKVTASTVAGWMAELKKSGVIRAYEVAGKPYFECVSWEEHQPMRYRRKSKIPAPDGVIPQNFGKFQNISPEVDIDIDKEGDREGIAPPPFCPKHPDGTDSPCRACGNARRARTAWETAQASKPTPTPRRPRPGDGHDHKPDEHGYCRVCGERAKETA